MSSSHLALSCLDLTNLENDCTESDIAALCARAVTPHGPVAAVCIWPRFVAQAADALGGRPVRIATVANFPGGDQSVETTVAETQDSIRAGADEIDLVIPYRRLRADTGMVAAYVSEIRQAAHGVTLKTILETGELEDEDQIRLASEVCLAAGADFLKTSTGKVAVNATPEAAEVMLETIRAHGGRAGFKAAGGIRTPEAARSYLDLADTIMGPGWAGPKTFRFGASGLLDTLTADIEGRAAASGSGY
ncbi:deoxyribose-phosphate aldolase [Fulvimarina endophytica]|uniref:Deoxyribose-phosphate aldolase n=1 Tax=Fulvimarina endophytica TaxID=2293836 RepID=A0A371X1H2_9HYPH|nr:deoxyribose-phosphate aldolase [Fulvimarina endophytica]RFC63083.1 deoxyribose-phosphate aldolase [Fulvimarina endophytica]